MLECLLAIFGPNHFPYKYSNILNPIHSSYQSAYEDWTECSETSAYKFQTPGYYPEESIQHLENDESLKSRKPKYYLQLGHDVLFQRPFQYISH
jgi:hypothetical protein